MPQALTSFFWLPFNIRFDCSSGRNLGIIRPLSSEPLEITSTSMWGHFMGIAIGMGNELFSIAVDLTRSGKSRAVPMSWTLKPSSIVGLRLLSELLVNLWRIFRSSHLENEHIATMAQSTNRTFGIRSLEFMIAGIRSLNIIAAAKRRRLKAKSMIRNSVIICVIVKQLSSWL